MKGEESELEELGLDAGELRAKVRVSLSQPGQLQLTLPAPNPCQLRPPTSNLQPLSGAAAERAARSQSRRGRSLVRKRGRSEADAEMAEGETPQKRIHSSKSRWVIYLPVRGGAG